jgi:hypothetical protein
LVFQNKNYILLLFFKNQERFKIDLIFFSGKIKHQDKKSLGATLESVLEANQVSDIAENR